MSAGDDGRGATADAASRPQEDEELQRALALSLADGGSTACTPDEGLMALCCLSVRCADHSRSVRSAGGDCSGESSSATSVPSLHPAAGRHARQAASKSSIQQRPPTKPAVKRKPAGKAQQDKRRRLEAAAPPSDEDVLAVFELFNQQQMSAIIAADIDKVTSTKLVHVFLPTSVIIPVSFISASSCRRADHCMVV
jgi:Ubiquitin interaction motif